MRITVATKPPLNGWWKAQYDVRYSSRPGAGYTGWCEAKTRDLATRRAMAEALRLVTGDVRSGFTRIPKRFSIVEEWKDS